ncbi:hypothetical protein BKA66DRAFT_441023 [Pyrenochaeta sp. MPI-SDFR-AT-0127]|nr:hypothetical protein BKA66DRAFT_441023 [Pyrenochaeta sp. MPI-SDFR-AT-0127]
MATTAAVSNVLHSQAALCPPPLLIQKKAPRRATFRRCIYHKKTPTQNSNHDMFGPLDDIIDEIKSVIWESMPVYGFGSFVNDWADSLNMPPIETMKPLPVSHIPSNKPLTIRKNRNSRASASGSSFGDPSTYSRNSSQDETNHGGATGLFNTAGMIPWPLLDISTAYEPTALPRASKSAVDTEGASAQQALESVIQNAPARPDTRKRHASRLRLFTNGVPFLRRSGTRGKSDQFCVTFDTTPLMAVPSITTHDDVDVRLDTKRPGGTAAEVCKGKHVRNGTRFGSVKGLITRRLPSPIENLHGQSSTAKTSPMPTTLQAAVSLFPEIKMLTEDFQEFCVAVDVEGVLHNPKPLPDTTVDLVLVVDNGFYVTRECLSTALNAVNEALHHVHHGDRLALCTAHWTHLPVTGTDVHYPLQQFSADTEDIFRDLTASIATRGVQGWEPPRPSLSMAEVILGIARSLEDQNLKPGRTHMILLSPAAHVLHDVSRSFPDLNIHQISPAPLPYRGHSDLRDAICTNTCCKNVFISNWSSYQSVSGCIERILKNARAEKPVGELTNVSIDVRTKYGCELLSTYGSRNISALRLGQVYAFFLQIRVTRAEMRDSDPQSLHPSFSSSLDVEDLKQDLRNAVAVNTIQDHLLDLQVFHQNTLHIADCWNYTETPLLLTRDLGGLASPVNTVLEAYKREYFYTLVHLTADEAKTEAENLVNSARGSSEQATKRVAERMAKEIHCHHAIQDCEYGCRQDLPPCFGPIEMEASAHKWLVDLWDKKKSKRKGVAVLKEEAISRLVIGVNAPERLG